MATATTNAYCDASTLANFNAWAYWMYQQFLAFGWVQTADTGQGTFPASGSVPTAVGYYAVFQSADSLSVACPITVRIDFWASGSNIPFFQLQIGTGGTDGAGNLNAPYSAKLAGGGTYVLQAYADDSSNLYPCYASGDAGTMRFAMFLNPALGYPAYYNPVYIIIGRSVNYAGAQTSDYATLWAGCQGGKYFQTVFNASTGGTNTFDSNNYMITPMQYGGSTTSQGGSVFAAPIMQNIGGLTNPTPDILLGKAGDFAGATTATVTMYNVSHTYLAINTSQFNNFISFSSTSLLMRYE
jgi:hypothetical protein